MLLWQKVACWFPLPLPVPPVAAKAHNNVSFNCKSCVAPNLWRLGLNLQYNMEVGLEVCPDEWVLGTHMHHIKCD